MITVLINGALYNLCQFVKVERISANNFTIHFAAGIQATNVTRDKIRELFPDYF